MKSLTNIIIPKAMKTQIIISFLLLVAFSINARPHADHEHVAEVKPEGTITLTATADFEPLLAEWQKAFNTQHPKTPVVIVETAPDAMQLGSIGMNITANEEDVWSVNVGRQIIVPVISNNHPYFEGITKSGITLEMLQELLSGMKVMPKGLDGEIIGTDPLVFYLLNEPSMIQQLEQAFGYNSAKSSNNRLEHIEDLRLKLTQNPAAIAFAPLHYLIDRMNPILYSGYSILPIDRNENGIIDRMEAFYGNPETFIRSAWMGKYPHALTVPVMIRASSSGISETQASFLSWVLTSGQHYLGQAGCVDLTGIERESGLAMITAPEIGIVAEAPAAAWLPVLLVIIGGLVIMGLVVTWLFRSSQTEEPVLPSPVKSMFSEDTIVAPKGMLYDKTHTWAFMENDGMVKIGMDSFLQHLAGQAVQIVSKPAGEKVAKGDHIITLVSNGKKMELRSPISGTIKACNTEVKNGNLSENLAENWVCSIEPANWKRDSQFMIMYEQYRQWLKDEFSRLRDFLASAMSTHATQYAQITLQDGGEFMEGLLAELGPEVWEDFQYCFLDSI
jgi:glycine cleavage system H lipoate-binding protein/ABC-type phosphate transport system substrate-binding protein